MMKKHNKNSLVNQSKNAMKAIFLKITNLPSRKGAGTD